MAQINRTPKIITLKITSGQQLKDVLEKTFTYPEPYDAAFGADFSAIVTLILCPLMSCTVNRKINIADYNQRNICNIVYSCHAL